MYRFRLREKERCKLINTERHECKAKKESEGKKCGRNKINQKKEKQKQDKKTGEVVNDRKKNVNKKL